jgi:hypothetical protein
VGGENGQSVKNARRITLTGHFDIHWILFKIVKYITYSVLAQKVERVNLTEISPIEKLNGQV